MKRFVLCLLCGFAALGGMVAAYNDTFPPVDEMNSTDDYSGPFRRMVHHHRMKHQKQNKVDIDVNGCTNTAR